MCNGRSLVSELDDVLQSGYYEYNLGFYDLDWIVDEVKKIRQKMSFFLKNTNKGTIKLKRMRNIIEVNKI